MKSFILKVGQPMIGIGVIVGLIISLLTAFFSTNVMYGGVSAVIYFLFMSTVWVAGIIITAFLVYILVDIRDELKMLNKKCENFQK